MNYGAITAIDYGTGQPVDILVDERVVKDILALVRKAGKAESRWDINLSEGQIAEDTLANLLNCNGEAVEVKRDFSVSTTGNIAVEFMCGGRPSGISVTEADWWAFSLSGDYYNDEVIVLIKKKRLERLLLPSRIRKGGDNHKAELYLVRVEELVKGLKGAS
jgi:hypothetical protein